MTPRPASPAGLAAAPETERLYLNVEGVRGKAASGVLTIAILGPASETPLATKTVAFFGLANASSTEGPHAGNGLSATVEITDVAEQLRAASGGAADTFDVRLSQPEGAEMSITVDRISIYSRAVR